MSSLLTAPARPARRPRGGRPKGPGGEQHILAALEDAAPSVRDRAIRLAARYVEPAVLGELVADGENAVRRNAAITALERQGPYAVPHLVAMLGRDDAELVLFALQILSRIGDASAGPAILPLLDHPDPNVAQAAIEALGQLRVQRGGARALRAARARPVAPARGDRGAGRDRPPAAPSGRCWRSCPTRCWPSPPCRRSSASRRPSRSSRCSRSCSRCASGRCATRCCSPSGW